MDRVYSCQSESYHNLSRLDYAFATTDLLPNIQSVSYISQTLFDHSALQVDLVLGHDRLFRFGDLALSASLLLIFKMPFVLRALVVGSHLRRCLFIQTMH